MSAFADPADPENSAWVAANAGAGKTHMLANRVTRLLLTKVEPERILCLTYTKAAAAEMQSRLFDRLGKWAMLPDADLHREVAEIGGSAPNLNAARVLFAKALETPGGLKIQTIHSFCQNLLARFPLEAGVTPLFRVLDDQTTRELINDTRSHVLERAGRGEEGTAEAVGHLATEIGEFRLQRILDASLGTDRRKIDRFLATLGDLRTSVRRSHDEPDDVGTIIATFCGNLRRDIMRLREAVLWLKGGSTKDIERGLALAAAIEADGDDAMFAALRDAFFTKSAERFANYATKRLNTARPDLCEFMDGIITLYCAAEERHRSARAAALAESALIVIHAVREEYARAKRVRGMLDYDDLINQALGLLKDSEAAAWVLYKLDGGIEHVLIDEAQDTSPEQWQIVQKLTEEFFVGAGRRREDQPVRTVFAVGDEKQSIFSFQGADPIRFEENRHLFLKRATAAKAYFVSRELPVSRRSLPQILTFVDQVFANDAASKGLTSGGHDVAHEAYRSEKTGVVEVWPSLPAPKTPKRDPWAPVDVEPEDGPVVLLAQRIAKQIREWMDKRVCLPGHDKPIRPADIMILLPRREPFASEIIRQLKHAEVPVAGADRMRLTEQIGAMDLIALGRFALLPEDDLTLATVLRSPLARVDEDALFALSHNRKGTLWRTLVERRNERPEYLDAHTFLSEMLALADFKPPFEFYAHALNALGMRHRLFARLGVEASDAIDEFLSLALTFESAHTPSLEGFLHWIERGAAEVKRDMEKARNEVRVMTVHGAKGLEADIVILPDTTTLPDNPAIRGSLLFTEDGVLFPLSKGEAPAKVRDAKKVALEAALEEHRRLFYVALTRAKDRLYICGFENTRGVQEGSWYSHASRAAREANSTPIERGAETLLRLGDDSATMLAPELARAPELPPLPLWATTPPPKEIVKPRLIRPFDAAGMDEPATISPLSEGGSSRFQRGLLVHTMLARLPDLAVSERRSIAVRFLTQRGMSEADAVTLADATLAVLANPDFARAFAAGSRPEVAIVADLPELGDGVRINGRIDRIAVTDTDVLIVDFKTNRPPPTREEDVPALYATQMALYRAAAAKIFPGRRIACALVWTEGPHLMTLSDALLEAETGRIRERLASD